LNDVPIGVPPCKIADPKTSNPGGTPMDRDTFIITVYCLVEDEFKKLRAVSRVRHAGVTPELSDAEVITMEICGEYFKLHTDKDLFDNSVRLNFCMAVALSDASDQYERSTQFPWPIH
jgi:hypothetical protein